MASRNEEVLGRAFAAFNARDIEALRELIDPEFEFAPHITGGFEGIKFQGIDGVERFIRMTHEAWESMHVDASEVHYSGDLLAVLGHLRARGRSSGIELKEQVVWLCQVRNGRALRIEARAATDPAAVARMLANAGLPRDLFDL
jgi:ketosteroid isomerase-like protein